MEQNQSPGASSAEEYDDVAVVISPEGPWRQDHSQGLPVPSMEGSPTSSAPPSKASLPMQKRRRVTRACDECRRKKIKCDGKQPCTHCTVYSYDCTYDQPSNRRRNPAPHYIEALESRLQRAEALLRTVLPDIDLDDPNIDLGMPQRMHPVVKQEISPVDQAQATMSGIPQTKSPQKTDVEKDTLLESMVDSVGLLDLDDQGYWDFHGHSSGLVFLRRMREQFGDLMGKTEGSGMPFLKSRSPTYLSQPLDSPKSSVESPADSKLPNTHELPAKECARQLCQCALDDACSLLRFVHQPTFYATFDRIYDVAPEQFGNDENAFLPLLYAVLALGCLFAKNEKSMLQIEGYESAIHQGFNWFKTSRQLMDVTDCRDLTSLQTLLFMIMFLQSSARLSTCYSHIGIALRSAIRMGLHRTVPIAFNPVERETRKRVFWVIRKMDTYVGALLGLPKMVNDCDIDQEMPLEVDDECITTEEILPMPQGKLSLMTAFNAHTRLLKILVKTVKYIYPMKTLENKSNQSYAVNHAKIREIEQDLQHWLESLPMALRPGGEAPPGFVRIQQLLRMAYAHIQMFLYRPFLHYVSQTVMSKSNDKRSYACAAACVSVSRNIVHITGEMKRRGLLIGSYWFNIYTTFFSILSLVFFVLENPSSPTSEDILRDAREGKDTLASLAPRSMAADRCSKTLAGLFEQLPEKLETVKVNSATPKKRPAPSKQSVHNSAPEMTPKLLVEGNACGFHERASCSPDPSSPAWKRASIPYDSSLLRQQFMADVDSNNRRSSHDMYSPTGTSSKGIDTPDSGSSNLPHSATQSTFGLPLNMANNAFPDVSAMMFPSADPFAYPNQPLSILENNQFTKQENPFNPDMCSPVANSSPGHASKNLDAQIFGPLPPYLMQGLQPGMGIQNMNMPVDMGGLGSGMAMNSDEDQWAQQQARTGGMSGMNLDQIFGEDWNVGWMDGFK